MSCTPTHRRPAYTIYISTLHLHTLGCHVLQPTGDLRIQYTLVHYTYILWDVMYSNPQATCVYNIH